MNKNRKRLEEIVLAVLVFVGLIFAIIGVHYSIHEKELLEDARQAGYDEGYDDGYYEGYQDGHYTGAHGMD